MLAAVEARWFDVAMTQITVLSGVERRRYWTDERNLALVEAAISSSVTLIGFFRFLSLTSCVR